METVYGDTSSLSDAEVYTLKEILQAKKFLNENTQSLLLRNALICWSENSTLPQSKELYEQYELNFRQKFLWKQIKQKDGLTKNLQMMNHYGKIPTQK